jgi:glycyl-tRNA synthetase beta chain
MTHNNEMAHDLLIELGTEELPPKALKSLAKAFTSGVVNGLNNAKLSMGDVQTFATPRRLAILIKSVASQQADQHIERKGPAAKAALDKDGNPSRAILGFAKSCGVDYQALDKIQTDKGEWFVFKQTKTGQKTTALIEAIVATSLDNLPTPKRMRWGNNDVEFVRPAKWLLALFGSDIIEMNIMGLTAGRTTRGHRFHQHDDLTIDTPSDYEAALLKAYVVADFTKRRNRVQQFALEIAQELGGQVIINPDLLDEVTALVEWPVAISGSYDEEFLDVPKECLISTMEEHQKYFAVVDQHGVLLPYFITTSNIVSKDPNVVREGNERVIRPRFSDAAFFWQQDRKQPLATHIEATKRIIFQQQLGTLFEKTERVAQLAAEIAQQTDADVAEVSRAAVLSKCDLMTNMVNEFPKLQGTMGRYYALHDGETENVAYALEQQYQPRYAGDNLPENHCGLILSLADKLDTLMGIFAIGQKPTGTKDPFALRRAALGVLRIIIEKELDLDIKQLLTLAAASLSEKVDAQPHIDATFDYILERLHAYYRDQGIAADIIDAVAKLKPSRPLDFDQRVHAVASFRELDEASALAAANKRISNILKKLKSAAPETIDEALFSEDAEKALFAALTRQRAIVLPLFRQGDYKIALTSLAQLRNPVDTFFDNVMVMTDDEAIKNNRLALLNQLRNTFIEVADLSVLQ